MSQCRAIKKSNGVRCSNQPKPDGSCGSYCGTHEKEYHIAKAQRKAEADRLAQAQRQLQAEQAELKHKREAQFLLQKKQEAEKLLAVAEAQQRQQQQQAQMVIQRQQAEKEQAQLLLQQKCHQQQQELTNNVKIALEWVRTQAHQWTMMEQLANLRQISAQIWVNEWSRTFHVQLSQLNKLVEWKALPSCQCQYITTECLMCKNNRMKQCGLTGIPF
jgi:hypothetical protein